MVVVAVGFLDAVEKTAGGVVVVGGGPSFLLGTEDGVLSGVVVALAFREEPWRAMRFRLFLYFLLATASHGFLDAMTHGGLGIAFFAPFDDTRYLFPFRPIPAAPLSIAGFFTGDGLRILASEVVWIWIPSVLLTFASRWREKQGSLSSSSEQ